MNNKTYYLKITIKEANSGMVKTLGTDINDTGKFEALQLIADASKEIDKAIRYIDSVEDWTSLEHSPIDCITVECRNKRIAKILHEYVNQEVLKMIIADSNK
jgi:hypothetical protein